MSDKNWGEAIPALEQCIQVRPNYSAAYFALAQSLQQQEQFEQEIQELEQLGSSIDDFQKLKLQELKMKHENNQEMINTYSAK